MPYMLDDLIVDRVDLVDEGANSAAFIEVFKRKEKTEPMEITEILSKMKPEHATVIQAELDNVNEQLAKANDTIAEQADSLKEANEALAKANEEIDVLKSKECECDGEADENGVCTVCGKPKKSANFDEAEVLKSMPEGIRSEYLKMRAQKEAAEEQVRKAAEEKAEAEAVAKAASLKALPVEQEKLVSVLKNCNSDVVDILTTVAAAIDGTVLGEVGKSGKGKTNKDAWGEIEAKAAEIAERDNITKQKAIGIAIKENPDLYREYLKGEK